YPRPHSQPNYGYLSPPPLFPHHHGHTSFPPQAHSQPTHPLHTSYNIIPPFLKHPEFTERNFNMADHRYGYHVNDVSVKQEPRDITFDSSTCCETSGTCSTLTRPDLSSQHSPHEVVSHPYDSAMRYFYPDDSAYLSHFRDKHK
ncbi:unnamed protein product, partial [Candidula unifasciata]